MAAILEFYFRFLFRSMYSHRHTMLHMPATFRSKQTIVGGVMMSYNFFQDGGNGVGNVLTGSRLVTVSV